MKKTILTLFAIALTTFSFAQNDEKLKILNKFIVANNTATEQAFMKFIKETYEPDLYKTIDLKAHVEFYMMIAKDFGKLKTRVYKKIEENPLKLVVYLIKERESLLNTNIDPAEILVVDLDLNKNKVKFLNRALGLGALICEIKKG